MDAAHRGQHRQAAGTFETTRITQTRYGAHRSQTKEAAENGKEGGKEGRQKSKEDQNKSRQVRYQVNVSLSRPLTIGREVTKPGRPSVSGCPALWKPRSARTPGRS